MYPKINNKQFNKVIETLRMGERPRESAYLVLVEGLTQQEAGSRQKITKAAVGRSVKRFLNEFKKTQNIINVQELRDKKEIPDNWETVIAFLPKNEAESVKDLEINLLKSIDVYCKNTNKV